MLKVIQNLSKIAPDARDILTQITRQTKKYGDTFEDYVVAVRSPYEFKSVTQSGQIYLAQVALVGRPHR